MWKLMIRRIVFILLAIVFLNSRFALSAQEKRTALVIGNGDYKSAPLRNPVNDATDVANTLNKLGFNVTLKTNVDQRDMEESIRDFGKELQKGGVGLFYYAGHGLQSKGRNYLIPIDADIRTEADVKYEAVDAGRVLSQMEDAENGLNIIILDACRDNPFERSFRSNDRGLARMDAPTGSILAYSTAPGSVAADGTDRNGLYTSMLLRHIMTPGLEVGKLFRQVRIDVVKASNEMQIPWETSSLMGDFYFNTKRGINVEARTETDLESPTKETPKYAALHPDDTRPNKLAIFPLKLVLHPQVSRPREFFMSIIIGSISHTIDETQLFNPVVSYYEIDKKFNTKLINKNIPGIDSVWKKNTFLSNYKPNIDVISKIGLQMNVDAVLMYDIGLTNGDDIIRVYLVDVNKQKIFNATGETINFKVAEGDIEINRITKQVFSEYQAEQNLN